MTFAISLFNSVGDTRPQAAERTWAQFCKKFSRPMVRAEKDGLLFSPARYSGNRRLQANVVELSLLVLEIDGAWRCECCGTAGPHIMFVTNRRKMDSGQVDRSPRCPSCFKSKCAKCYRKEPKPRTETTLAQIAFSFESVIEGMRRVFPGSAFGIYSTHSHQRVTAVKCGVDVFCQPGHGDASPCGAVFGHEFAERCSRLVVPLAAPVPAAEFSNLWTWAVNSLAEYDVIADPQSKDPNRIFYTPVKSAPDAPYEFHVEPGEAFDWKAVPLNNRGKSTDFSRVVSEPKSPTEVGTLTLAFATHEDRHEELARRIMARGKLNSRGHWDARCIAHGGRGNTGMCYFPDSTIVQCNNGCGYFELLRAEGLPDNHLPSRDRHVADQARQGFARSSVAGHPSFTRTGPLTVSQMHAIYATLLAHCFELSPEHEALVRKHWNLDPFGEEMIPYFGEEERPERPVKLCSMPTAVQKTIAVNQLSRLFDLTEVPGFFRELGTKLPQEPTRASEIDHWQTREFGPWRINLVMPKGLLVPYHDEAGYIIGIKIYKTLRSNPTLLTSRGLPCGARAIRPREAVAA